jgi:hypothetical protein
MPEFLVACISTVLFASSIHWCVYRSGGKQVLRYCLQKICCRIEIREANHSMKKHKSVRLSGSTVSNIRVCQYDLDHSFSGWHIPVVRPAFTIQIYADHRI